MVIINQESCQWRWRFLFVLVISAGVATSRPTTPPHPQNSQSAITRNSVRFQPIQQTAGILPQNLIGREKQRE